MVLSPWAANHSLSDSYQYICDAEKPFCNYLRYPSLARTGVSQWSSFNGIDTLAAIRVSSPTAQTLHDLGQSRLSGVGQLVI